MASISFEIIEHIGVLSENPKGWRKELNLISWNGHPPKYDIRDWAPNYEKMGKGITLNENEFATLGKMFAINFSEDKTNNDKLKIENWIATLKKKSPLMINEIKELFKYSIENNIKDADLIKLFIGEDLSANSLSEIIKERIKNEVNTLVLIYGNLCEEFVENLKLFKIHDNLIGEKIREI